MKITIDIPTLTSLFTWARTFNRGKPVVLELVQDSSGNTLCRVYRSPQEGFPALPGEKPLAETQVA